MAYVVTSSKVAVTVASSVPIVTVVGLVVKLDNVAPVPEMLQPVNL